MLIVGLVIYISDQFGKPLDKIWRDYLSLVTGQEEHSDHHLSDPHHDRQLETNSDGYCVIEDSEEQARRVRYNNAVSRHNKVLLELFIRMTSKVSNQALTNSRDVLIPNEEGELTQ